MGEQIIGYYGHLIQPHKQQSRTITINSEAVPFASGISEAQAKALLDQDLKPIRCWAVNLLSKHAAEKAQCWRV